MACEYCEKNADKCLIDGVYTRVFINYVGQLISCDYEYGGCDSTDIRFCPMCGEKLGDTNE